MRTLFSLFTKQPHEPDFEIFRHFDGESGVFVDVGANSGQSAISFRMFNKTFRIISFEPNPLHKNDLRFVRKLIGTQFEYHMVGIGNETLTRHLLIPAPAGIPLTQEATFLEEELNHPVTRQRIFSKCHTNQFKLLKFEIPLRKLDEFDLKPDFIKLDVQGYELKTLEGMHETLSKAKPIILVENGKDISRMAEILKPHGYRLCHYDRTTRQLYPILNPEWSLNVFFVPIDRFAFLALHGIDLSKIMAG